MSLLKALNLPPLRPQAPAGAGSVSIAIDKPGPFEPGSRQQLSATALLPDGSIRNVTGKVRWESSDENVVKMLPGRPSGLAQVLRAGRVTITATLIGGKAQDTITVKIQARLQDIVITPENPLLEAGETEELTATGIRADGSTEDITFEVEWSSNKPRVAFFEPDSGGSCETREAGTALVAATHPDAPDVHGFTKVEVFAPGRGPALQTISLEPLNPDIKEPPVVQFRAWGHFAGNVKHEITRHVRWTSSDPTVLTINADGGRARPRLRSGNPVVTAVDRVTGKSQSTTVYVALPGVRDISVEEGDLTIAVGASATVNVTATFHGIAQTMRVNELVQWTPTLSNVATVPGMGNLVHGDAPGETDFTVLERLSGASTVVHVTVVPATTP